MGNSHPNQAFNNIFSQYQIEIEKGENLDTLFNLINQIIKILDNHISLNHFYPDGEEVAKVEIDRLKTLLRRIEEKERGNFLTI